MLNKHTLCYLITIIISLVLTTKGFSTPTEPQKKVKTSKLQPKELTKRELTKRELKLLQELVQLEDQNPNDQTKSQWSKKELLSILGLSSLSIGVLAYLLHTPKIKEISNYEKNELDSLLKTLRTSNSVTKDTPVTGTNKNIRDFIKKITSEQKSTLSSVKVKFTPDLNPTELEAGSAKNKAIGSMLGMVVGDALGAPMEFLDYEHHAEPRHNMHDMQGTYNRFQLQPGQWTDDSSMGLCLADSLLSSEDSFYPKDLRMRFLLWWHLGYNNGLQGRTSVGLGGNISESFKEFASNLSDYTLAGDIDTSGNGGLMRLAPAAIRCHNDLNSAMKLAKMQSLATHQGTEAQELAQVMAYIIVQGIKGEKNLKATLNSLHETFKDKNFSPEVMALLESSEAKTTNGNNWNWKDSAWNAEDNYEARKEFMNKTYFGAYSMDAMAMALHALYQTSSFEGAVSAVAGNKGDADTVAAITGQMAGAFYGIEAIPQRWLEAVKTRDPNNDIINKANRLFEMGASCSAIVIPE